MNLKGLLTCLAVGGMLVWAVPAPQAQAATVFTPGVAATTAGEAGALITKAHWRHHRHHWRRHHHRHHRHHWRSHHRHHHGHHHRRHHRR